MFKFGQKKIDAMKREEIVFDAIMETVEDMINKKSHELMDIMFAVALAVGVKTKKVADNYDIEKLKKFSESLLKDVNERVIKEAQKAEKLLQKEIKNIYDKPKTTKLTKPSKAKKIVKAKSKKSKK